MAACAGCARENPAGARFCMGCGAALVAPCPRCSSEVPTDAAFCGYCGNSISIRSYGPIEMIKLVTVLFADVVGSTAQAESMHPEDTRALIAEFFQAMSEEIRAEGGTIERLIGDAIMADFGVPIAHEDDPVRAVKAARRMLERLEKFNADRDDAERIQIRIGINTGAVSTGGSFGEQLLVMGDAVNVAARLEQAAPPGAILIGERTARAVRDDFRLREIDSLSAKGKTEPLVAFIVEGELERVADPDSQLPLVGREPELQKLHSEFAGIRSDGAPRLVTIIGDPGVGKSRLTREFVGSVSGEATILFGRCLPYGDGVTFWPLLEIVRAEARLSGVDTALDERERLDSFVREHIPAEGPDRETVRDALFATLGFQLTGDAAALDPRETFRRMLDGWRLLLSRYAQRSPLVVVIEDVHWADASMLEVIDDLIRHVEGPVLFVCPTRPDLINAHPEWVAGLRNYTSVNLDPLTDEESSRFISLLLEIDEIPERLTQRILDRAEGNPFFLEEILNRLIDEGYFALREGRWEPVGDVSNVEVPDNVQAAILARLDLLSPEERRVVQLASVVGRTFWRSLLQHLVGAQDVGPSLEALARRHLILERPRPSREGDAEYSFKHVLTRDVAYESLPRKARGEAHAAVGGWVETIRGPRASEVAELVAHHFERAWGSLEDHEMRRKARVYFVVSSRNAALRFATAQAETLGRRAVELSLPGEERMEALEILADVMYLSGSGDMAWETYLAALDEIEGNLWNSAAVSRICANAAIIPTRNWGSIDRPPPDEQVRQVIDMGFAAPPHPGTARDHCVLLAARAFFEADHGRPAEARAAADEALALGERLNDPDLISIALDARAGTYMHPDGRYDEVDRITRRRLELLPRLSDLAEITDVQGMAAVTATLVGRYADAVRHATASGRTGRAIDVGSYIHGLNWRAQAHFMSGEWDAALRDEAEIARIERRDLSDLPGPYSARAYAAACFCHILRAHRDQDPRIEVIRRFRDESEWFRNVSALPARGLARRGRTSEALEWLDLSRWMYRGQHLEAACDVIAFEEDWGLAAEILGEARAEADACGLLALAAFADRLEGQMSVARGNPDAALAALQLSDLRFTKLGSKWEAGWSRLLAAEALLEAGQVERAVEASRSASNVFRSLGSVMEIDRAEALRDRAQPA